jgi:hypothetical protein
MDIHKLTQQAKDLIDRRGGTDALKADAMELKDIATGEGSLTDKATAALDAVKDSGAPGEEPAGPAR